MNSCRLLFVIYLVNLLLPGDSGVIFYFGRYFDNHVRLNTLNEHLWYLALNLAKQACT